jgi:hypothetical protein
MGPLFTESPDHDFWWNTQLDDGTYTISADPVGWDSTAYVTPIDEVGGRDGGLYGPQSVAPRIIEVDALMVAPDAATLRQNIARIGRILGPQGEPGPRQPVIWEQHDFGTGERLALLTRPTGQARFPIVPGYARGGVAAQAQFQLVAANPVWKFRSGAAEWASVGLLDTSLVQGRTYNRTYDYTYGAATAIGGEMEVVNSGDLAAWPLFTVTGPVDTPIITNVTTSQDWAVNKVLAAGEVVTVDSRSGAVTPASVRLVGRPFALAPGSNTIRWRSLSGTYYPGALLRLDWRSTSR